MSISVEGFRDLIEGASDQELAGFAAVSPAIHFATFVHIHDKGNRLIRPIPNILQLRMSQVYEQCMDWGIPCRMVVCKPRQVGCSTFTAHIIYHHEQRFRSTGITIADVSDNSVGLMKKVAEYAERDAFPWNNQLRSMAKRLEFSNGTVHTIDSAENWKAGISQTRQVFHASEIGKWPKSGVKEDRRVMASVMPSIAKQPNTVVIAEGTPDGAVGWLYDQWHGKDAHGAPNSHYLEDVVKMRAEGTMPGVVWIKVFAAWFEFAEHQHDGQDGRPPLPKGEERAILKTLTERERRGQDLYNWTLGQIAWRRAIIATECGGDEELFDEYYAEDDMCCFLSSGRPRFNMGCVTAMEKMAKLITPERGFLISQPDNKTVQWNRDSQGDVEIWEKPQEGCRYLVSCDPMTGTDQTSGKDPDRHSIGVLRQGYDKGIHGGDPVDPMLVARVKGPYLADTDQAAGQIINLSRMYGECIVVLEINMGLGILELLKFSGVPLLQREVFDARVGSKKRQFGYKLSNRDERRYVIDALATAIREMAFVIRCPHALGECKTFVTSANGRDEARAGTHDDDIFMLAMGYISLSSATMLSGRVRKRRDPPDRKDWRTIGSHW